LEQLISETISQRMLLMLKQAQQLGSDVVDFGYYLRPQFTTDQEFKDLHWDTIYPKAEFNVLVTTQLRRSGIMRKSSPIR